MRRGHRCFNPLPAFRPGETRRLDFVPQRRRVSIRSRLFGREKPRQPMWQAPIMSWFQSAPGFSAGRNSKHGAQQHASACFNPLPAFRPGETLPLPALMLQCRPFQSAPGFSAGRNRWFHNCFCCGALCFNPLPAFRPGETRIEADVSGFSPVSIRSRLFGREKPTAS